MGPSCDRVGNAMRDGSSFARASTCQDHHRSVDGPRHCLLFGIQTGEQVIGGWHAMHASVIPMKMYTTVWCGYCQRLKAQMGREGIAFEEIDIEADPAAAAYVESVNGGNQTVPTLLFDDGTALTNPSIGDVKAKLGVA